MKPKVLRQVLAKALRDHDLLHMPRPASGPSVHMAAILTGFPPDQPQVLSWPSTLGGKPFDLAAHGYRLSLIDPHDGQVLDTTTVPHRWVDGPVLPTVDEVAASVHVGHDPNYYPFLAGCPGCHPTIPDRDDPGIAPGTEGG